MHNWNWSYTLSKSVVAIAIASSLASNSAQAQIGTQTEIKSTSPSTSLKVGETRSQSLARSKDDSVARIHTHKLDGKNAATVYVRGIPVVTYIESQDSTKSNVNVNSLNSLTKVKGSGQENSKGLTKKNSESFKLPSDSEVQDKLNNDDYERLLTSPNPVERATATAALINQLSRDGLDAGKIIPAWRNGNYVIKFGDRATLKFDQQVLFSDSLKNETKDVLESANLLRRLLGGASPVTAVLDSPKVVASPVAVFSDALNNRVVGVMSGMASWYGPGFDGNYSASGEIFNANALTAAHPSLPFGTVVRVMNMDNGQSVVVRINDRGPYAHDRIIDISTAAANVIGLISSGVAPVRLEVLSK